MKKKQSGVRLRDKKTGRFTKWSEEKTVSVEVYRDGQLIDKTRPKVYYKAQIERLLNISQQMVEGKKSKSWKLLKERIDFFNENFYTPSLRRFFAYYYLMEKLTINLQGKLSEEKIFEIWQDVYKNADFTELDSMEAIKVWSDGLLNDIMAAHNILGDVKEPTIGIVDGELVETDKPVIEPEPDQEPEPEPIKKRKTKKKTAEKSSKKKPAKPAKKKPAAKPAKKKPAAKPAKKKPAAKPAKSTKKPAKTKKAVKRGTGKKKRVVKAKSVKAKRQNKKAGKNNRTRHRR